MSNPTSENLPDNNVSAENEIDKAPDKNKLGLGFIGNVFWEAAVFIGIKATHWTDEILPNWPVLLLLGGVAVLMTVLIRIYFNHLTDFRSYAHYVRYALIIASVALGSALFIICCKTMYDYTQGRDILYNIKVLVGIAMFLSVLIVNIMYANHKYRNIRRNKQQLDIRKENSSALNKLSEENRKITERESKIILDSILFIRDLFPELLKKVDMNTAYTGTIIPFQVDNSSKVIRTYLMDNVKSYQKYSWMFAGGHVVFSENDSPDMVAINRAKTELGLNVELLGQKLSLDDDELVDNMVSIRRPDFVYKFIMSNEAKCFREKGHEYHLDMVYLGRITGIADEILLRQCIKIEIPLKDGKITKEQLTACIDKGKNSFYRSKNVSQRKQRDVPDYVAHMLYAAYDVVYDKWEKNHEL